MSKVFYVVISIAFCILMLSLYQCAAKEEPKPIGNVTMYEYINDLYTPKDSAGYSSSTNTLNFADPTASKLAEVLKLTGQQVFVTAVFNPIASTVPGTIRIQVKFNDQNFQDLTIKETRKYNDGYFSVAFPLTEVGNYVFRFYDNTNNTFLAESKKISVVTLF